MGLQKDYRVMAVASGEEAIQAANSGHYPVVILDLCMQGLSGIDTLRQLKSIDENQKVIILTGYQSMESAIDALNLGAYNYLTKPFDMRHLRQVVNEGFRVYQRSRLQQEELRERLQYLHDKFFSMLCHEFNTPLNCIIGFSEIMSQDLVEAEQREWALHINESGLRLHDLLMEVIDYIDASNRSVVDYDQEFVLFNLIDSVASGFRNKGFSIELERGDVLQSTLQGPAQSLKIILRKLLKMVASNTNSCRMSATLNQHTQGGFCSLTIELSRTGLKLDAAGTTSADDIFEPYSYQTVDNKGGSQNLGLELATCRKIAEMAGANVTAAVSEDMELIFRCETQIRQTES